MPNSPRGRATGRRAFIIGGTGLIGRAIARRLVSAGWSAAVVGRQPANLSRDLVDVGVRFFAADRADATALQAAFRDSVGAGADLLVDCACYTAAHAKALLPLARDAASTVMLSSKAVYVDAAGRHANSDEPPCYDGPISESQPTVPPGDMPYKSREGYGPNKVAAERVLLESGLPVTVLRPSKVHGDGARPPREWVFVKRVLDRRPAVLLAHQGRGVDHTSAAANIAALVETVADHPGARILNAADPDAPSGAEIARIVSRHFGHTWTEILLDDGASDAEPGLGWHPWDARHPVILDMRAALEIGYRPVGDYAETVGPMLDWLARIAVSGGRDGAALPTAFEDGEDGYFAGRFDYGREDRFLDSRNG